MTNSTETVTAVDADPSYCNCGCGQEVSGKKSVYVPGHDARHVSLTVHYATMDSQMPLSVDEYESAIEVGKAHLGEATPLFMKFSRVLANAQDKAIAAELQAGVKAQAKANRAAKKAARKSAQYEPISAKIKVGRWTHEATADKFDDLGKALEWTYTDKKGEVHTVPAQDAKLVA